MALDAADIAEDIAEEADKAADPVAVDALAAVPVALAAQIAAVGRFVTPAGTQMLSAYLIVAVAECKNDFFAQQYSSSGAVQLTLLVGFVADFCNTACNCLDETRVGANAFGVKVARVRDSIDRAVLLRGYISAHFSMRLYSR
jgi:hypothetical protein